jgi:hypothetical protein
MCGSSAPKTLPSAPAPITAGVFGLQVLHKPAGDDLRHKVIGVGDALAALISKRIGERDGRVQRVSEREPGGVGHYRTIAEAREQSKVHDADRAAG